MKSSKFVIDRFEGGFAVLQNESAENISVRRSMLPKDASEGDYLGFGSRGFYIDSEETKAAKARIKKLYDGVKKKRL